MSWRQVTSRSLVNQRLREGFARNKELIVARDATRDSSSVTNEEINKIDRDGLFKDPSIFLEDPDSGGLCVFSMRRDASGDPLFFEGSWGSFSDAALSRYTPSYIATFFNLAFQWAESNWPGLPFSASYAIETCPWLIELRDRDFTVATNLVAGVNTLRPRLVQLVVPPVRLTGTKGRVDYDLGTVVVRTPVVYEANLGIVEDNRVR